MSDDLDKKTDDELNELFAVDVAEIWRPEIPRSGGSRAYSVVGTGAWREIRPDQFSPEDLPDYCTDANAVLPWLEKAGPWNCFFRAGYETEVEQSPGANPWASSATFARAAVLALIRAARAKK